jgi:hypothetical protein
MKKFVGKKKLAISKETLRVLEPGSLDKVAGGTHPTIIVIIILTTMLGSDTPQ